MLPEELLKLARPGTQSVQGRTLSAVAVPLKLFTQASFPRILAVANDAKRGFILAGL